MREWRPISTADKDSLGHILVSNGARVYVAWYDDLDEQDAYWSDATVGDQYDGRIQPQPTHWMPLPAPPKELGQ